MKSLAPKLREMDISLEHIFIYCIQHKTDERILKELKELKELKHVELTLKSIRSYRYPLTPGWLKRAAPYIKPTLFHSLKRREALTYLKARKRHRRFVKSLHRKIKRKAKHDKKRNTPLPVIVPLSISLEPPSPTKITTQTPLPVIVPLSISLAPPSPTKITTQTPLPRSPLSPDPFKGIVASAGLKTVTLKK